ncbi:MAG: folate-binding protein [Bauldia sp.]
MADGRIAELPRRGVVAVGGEDAEKFLNDLITADMPKAAGTAAYGGLLTPQGKILFDAIIFREGERFLFDLPRALAADFARRLGFYRLRARVEIADLSAERIAVAAWGNGAPILDGPVAPDPRLTAIGYRAIVPAGADMAPDFAEATEAEYDAHRVALGVPEGGIDFAFGDAFPHDADMDQLRGVDFTKGCYVGQEVVSRMEHRGTARRRFVLATGAGALPAIGTPVTAGERAIGTLGSSSGDAGLALVRLDRAKEATDAGAPLSAGGVPLTLTIPPWAKFTWPVAVAADD